MERQTFDLLAERFISCIPEWRESLMREMKVVELEAVWDRELTRRIVNRRTTREQASRRCQQARARRHEAQALYAAASEEYKKHLKEEAQRKMAQEKAVQESLNHGIVVEDTGPADIIRDISWVYGNWGELFVQDGTTGARILDPDILENAPSSGAVAMADFALCDPNGFFSKFVIRLIPKNIPTEEDEEQSEVDRISQLDASFNDMKDYWNLEVE